MLLVPVICRRLSSSPFREFQLGNRQVKRFVQSPLSCAFRLERIDQADRHLLIPKQCSLNEVTSCHKLFSSNSTRPLKSLNEKLSAESLVNRLGEPWIDYAKLLRLDKPIGVWLLLWPCWWSTALASSSLGCLPPLVILGQFAVGAVLMRGSGCIVNDLWDRKFDVQVARTRVRPLASGKVPLFDALNLLNVTSAAGLLVLVQFDWRSIVLGASSLGLVLAYPAFKRVTYWPQLVLGMTFNWGALLGWSVVNGGEMNWSATLPLYMAGICWTLFYDTIYAHQDRLDDIRIGLKSTAIKFDRQTHLYLAAFSTLMIASLTVAGMNTSQLWPYYVGVAGCGASLVNIQRQVNIDNVESCAKGFVRNSQIGWIVFGGILASTLLMQWQKRQQNIEESSTNETSNKK